MCAWWLCVLWTLLIVNWICRCAWGERRLDWVLFCLVRYVCCLGAVVDWWCVCHVHICSWCELCVSVCVGALGAVASVVCMC